MSDSLQPHGLQHTRLPCPSLSLRVCSNSCSSSRWCHPTISSSVVPFSSCLQSFPASGSFPVSQFFALSGHSIGASTSASVLPLNIQNWFPLGFSNPLLLLLLTHSVMSNSSWPHRPACQASLPLTISRSLPKLMSIASVMPSSHLILWCPLLLLPSIFPSIRVFSSELVLQNRWPKYWSFSFSTSPSNVY